MENKFILANKVISTSSVNFGYVYGKFVREVIIPRIIDPSCEISFDNIDIWFEYSSSKDSFLLSLNKEYRIDIDKHIPCITGSVIHNYKIYGDGLTFNINVIVSKKCPHRYFDVDVHTRVNSEGKFSCLGDEIINKIKNKRATMLEEYTSTENIEFEQINKDFFEKGWTVLSKADQFLFSKWIVQNNIPVLISFVDEHWKYSPDSINSRSKDIIPVSDDKLKDINIKDDENNHVFVIPLRISGTPKHIKESLKLLSYTKKEINDFLNNAISKNNYQTTKSKEYETEITSLKNRKMKTNQPKDDKLKDIMMSIFNEGLKVMETKFYNMEDEELQYVYKLGLDEYRNKFDNLLKETL